MFFFWEVNWWPCWRISRWEWVLPEAWWSLCHDWDRLEKGDTRIARKQFGDRWKMSVDEWWWWCMMILWFMMICDDLWFRMTNDYHWLWWWLLYYDDNIYYFIIVFIMFKFIIGIICFWWWWWWWSWWSSYHGYARRWYNLVIPWFCSDSHDLFFFRASGEMERHTHTHTCALWWFSLSSRILRTAHGHVFCRCLLQNFGGLSSSLKKKGAHTNAPSQKKGTVKHVKCISLRNLSISFRSPNCL